MKVHRFYIGDLHTKRGPVELRQHIWVHDAQLLNQWLKVLRLKAGDQLELFDDSTATKLYEIDKVEEQSVGLTLITEIKPTLPKKHLYLFWCLLKKDNNDLVLQKCTELGVRNFVPIISNRTEKTGFDEARARRIVIEAAEQCGRSDIPKIREPISLGEALDEYNSKVTLFFADMDGREAIETTSQPIGVFIGPEGGWSETEKQLLTESKVTPLNLHILTLRAETAAITAVNRLLQ